MGLEVRLEEVTVGAKLLKESFGRPSQCIELARFLRETALPSPPHVGAFGEERENCMLGDSSSWKCNVVRVEPLVILIVNDPSVNKSVSARKGVAVRSSGATHTMMRRSAQ